MSNAIPYPFSAFNFSIEIHVAGVPGTVCNASFAECDGLEMTMDVRTIKEGGNNATQVRGAGLVAYGTLTLKRGMTSSFDLWDWFSSVTRDPSVRGDALTGAVLAEAAAAAAASLVEINLAGRTSEAAVDRARDARRRAGEAQAAAAT